MEKSNGLCWGFNWFKPSSTTIFWLKYDLDSDVRTHFLNLWKSIQSIVGSLWAQQATSRVGGSRVGSLLFLFNIFSCTWQDGDKDPDDTKPGLGNIRMGKTYGEKLGNMVESQENSGEIIGRCWEHTRKIEDDDFGKMFIWFLHTGKTTGPLCAWWWLQASHVID